MFRMIDGVGGWSYRLFLISGPELILGPSTYRGVSDLRDSRPVDWEFCFVLFCFVFFKFIVRGEGSVSKHHKRNNHKFLLEILMKTCTIADLVIGHNLGKKVTIRLMIQLQNGGSSS